MGKTTIEWTQMTWNPIRGCSMAPGSETGGCLNCYAARQAARGLPGLCFPSDGVPAARMTASGPRWTGRVELIESMIDIPLRRRKPTTYFVNSMSDLFHEALPIEAIAEVFFRMAEAQQHTFQVLTKRADRLPCALRLLRPLVAEVWERFDGGRFPWPLPNVWLGVSCENQQTADERIPLLLQTPAAVRWVSLEPMLGPINVKNYVGCEHRRKYLGPGGDIVCPMCNHASPFWDLLDWVILGGESGPGARPLHPDWARSVRDQCIAAGVPFFHKQNGEWLHQSQQERSRDFPNCVADGANGCPATGWPESHVFHWPDGTDSYRVGKRAAGHSLDGQEWRQMPEVKR